MDIKNNLKQVRRRITQAAKRVGRDPSEIELIAVTKTHPPKAIKELLACGVAALGENKVQEAEGKIDGVGRNAAAWHLLGHLQKNKARKAVQLFDVIHSIDSPELAHRLERICIEESRRILPVLVQIDLAGETTKSGVSQIELQLLVEMLKRCERLKFVGLMVLPPYFDDPNQARSFFQQLRALRDRLAAEDSFANGMGHLSMGMSNDFEVAIEEGATMVRVGTAIFGDRG